jgi:uncharacterized protein (DUF1684 family)
MDNVQTLRAEKDHFFARSPHSPLTPAQQRSFHGLHYFPKKPALRFAAAVEVFPAQERIEMQTTTGERQIYIRHGRIRFTVDGQEVTLTVYRNGHGFFLPFVDALAGTETYGAGRYLEPAELPDGQLLIDFNLAYNPYCAYNDVWSCPITPAENRLPVPIRAGEKIFQHER